MAWTYDTSLSTDKDWVRFLIGDTNTNAQLVQDETIEAILTAEMNVYMAAAEICEYIARGLTRGGTVKDRKVGETKIGYRTSEGMLQLSHRLRLRGSAYMKPSAGGVYKTDTDNYDQDTTLDKPEIGKRMTNNPRSGSAQSLTNTTT
jgi:hypothetical protein